MAKKNTKKCACECKKASVLSSLVCWVKAKVGACRSCKCN